MAETFNLTVDADQLAADLLEINSRKTQGVMAQMFGSDPEDVLEIAIDVVNLLNALLMETLGDENIDRIQELQDALLDALEEQD